MRSSLIAFAVLSQGLLASRGAFGLESDSADLAEVPVAADSGGYVGPVLSPSWQVEPATHWIVGVHVEGAVHDVGGDNNGVQDTLIGLSAQLRWRAFGPHVRLAFGPDSSGYEDTRVFTALGLRGHVPVLGTEVSYGVGIHFDARLDRHYWLFGGTPVELGVDVYRAGSWRISILTGLRVAFAGDLVNVFLIDPNGFDSPDAKDALEAARDEQPWEAFFGVTFGRRL